MPPTAYSETATRADYAVRDHARLGRVGVITVGPAEGSHRPPTLGPQGIANFDAAVRRAEGDARAGHVAAVALTGTGKVFLAGADLDLFRAGLDRRFLTELGTEAHGVVARILDLPVPTLAHLNGATLGGGLEMALPTDLITAPPSGRNIGLPETSLGILPGWGGTTLLPLRIGAENALAVLVDRAQKNKSLKAADAHELGLVGALVEDLEAALDALADAVDAGTAGPEVRPPALRGGSEVRPAALRGGPEASDTAEPAPAPVLAADSQEADRLREAVAKRRGLAERLTTGGAPAVATLLDLVEQLPNTTLPAAFGREDAALADLAATDAAAASLYSADLLRGAKPSRTPVEGARPIRSVGVAGAGLMAAQIAAALAVGLRVPVTLRDLDDERAQHGLETARAIVSTAAEKGRLSGTDAEEIGAALAATTDLADLAGSDLVLEAVPEQLDIKRSVFAELETVVSPEALLVTNTSSLSVAAMAEGLDRPERVLGLHFFNPVDRMPLVEIVSTAQTASDVAATGREVVRRLGKTGVGCSDAPGFVVNRLLFRMFSEVHRAQDAGADPEAVDAALDPMGLPMRPSELLDLVGHEVAAHVGAILVADLGDRFYAPGVSPAPRPATGEGPGDAVTGQALLGRVGEALADEARRMLNTGVVARVEALDLAMLLGAGWPRHNGGLSPYLDRTGASAGVGRFHAGQPGV